MKRLADRSRHALPHEINHAMVAFGLNAADFGEAYRPFLRINKRGAHRAEILHIFHVLFGLTIGRRDEIRAIA